MRTTICAIDPGTTKSAYVIVDKSFRLLEFGWDSNESILMKLRDVDPAATELAVEMVASYGMPVGRSTFETVLWLGRFVEAYGGQFTKVYRKTADECESVAMHLCKTTRAKDANIRQALLDRYEKTGGGKTPQVGTKSQPGPLFGVSSHVWAALAVAVTFIETNGRHFGRRSDDSR